MIFTDVAKLLIGRPRPIFLETCVVNDTMCASAAAGTMFSDEICQQSDRMRLRWARLVSVILYVTTIVYYK